MRDVSACVFVTIQLSSLFWFLIQRCFIGEISVINLWLDCYFRDFSIFSWPSFKKFPENSSQRILSSEENPRGKSLIKENYFPTQFVPYGKTMTRFASGCKNVTEIFHLRAVRKRVGGFGVKDDFINPRCLFCLIVQRIFTDSQA